MTNEVTLPEFITAMSVVEFAALVELHLLANESAWNHYGKTATSNVLRQYLWYIKTGDLLDTYRDPKFTFDGLMTICRPLEAYVYLRCSRDLENIRT